MTKLYISSDHAGFKLKQKAINWLQENKIDCEDLGSYVVDPDDDYPDYAEKVAKKVAVSRGKCKGVLICGSAQGVCIAANKIKGIRAVVPFSIKGAQLAREHEDANVLCLSGWFYSERKAIGMVRKFLQTRPSRAARHLRRIRKIKKLEEG